MKKKNRWQELFGAKRAAIDKKLLAEFEHDIAMAEMIAHKEHLERQKLKLLERWSHLDFDRSLLK